MNTLTLKARLADPERRKFFVAFFGGKLLGPGVAFYAIVSLGSWFTARTEKIGYSKIWSVPLDRVMRVRTGEMGNDAL